jgi:zinc/manganese transport system substrate-binding protein
MKRIAVALATLLTLAASPAFATMKVVTSLQDFSSIAEAVGGPRVEVFALAKGYQDPHFVEPKPSFILKLSKADLLIVAGLELEIGYLPPLIDQSRNEKIRPGGPGYLDASAGCDILERPTGTVTRAMGDVHPFGNPHYWLDPDNGRRMAQAIQAKLSAMDAADKAYFAQRYADFDKRLTEASKRWDAALVPYKGTKIVTYHRSWPNFADRFGLDVIGYVEPRPGIPPSPSHTLDLINEMKRQNVKLILVEPYFDLKTPQSIGRETGAQVLMLPPSVGGAKEVTDYIGLFDYDVNAVVAAIKRTGAK